MPRPRPRTRARDIQEVTTEVLRCLVYRHHSFPLPVWIESYTDSGTPALRADVRCECGVRKVMYAHPTTFERWPSADWYDHPEGTLVEGGRPRQVEANLEAKRRQDPKLERAERKRVLQLAA